MSTIPTSPNRERIPAPVQRPNEIGVTTTRADGIPKVKGEFEYSSDMRMDGMLWGATLRSPHPRADIWSIDTARALALPGVHAVLTHEDVPGRKVYGMEIPDQPVLAWNHVRYQGEPVAWSPLRDPETARRALDAIEVDYDVLDPLTDPESAMAPRRAPPAPLGQRPAPRPDQPRRPRGERRGRRHRRVRGRHAGPGLPRPRVRAGGARRRRRHRPVHRHPVAARRPRSARPSASACRPRRCV